MSKQAMRDETERLIREAMEKKSLSIKKGDTRIEAKCGKCGVVNKITAPAGETRVKYKCKECGHQQNAL
jgi:phage FluMu protein Com